MQGLFATVFKDQCGFTILFLGFFFWVNLLNASENRWSSKVMLVIFHFFVFCVWLILVFEWLTFCCQKRLQSVVPCALGGIPNRIKGLWNWNHLSFLGKRFHQSKHSLGIQSYSQLMIGVSNHLLSIGLRFHYHSQKVIGSLGTGKQIDENRLSQKSQGEIINILPNKNGKMKQRISATNGKINLRRKNMGLLPTDQRLDFPWFFF